MKTNSFTLFVDGVGELTQNIEDLLYDAGCSDALIFYGIEDGQLTMDFDREAESYAMAMLSAIQDVEKAHSDAKVVRVVFKHGEMSGPDLKEIIASAVTAPQER